MRPFVHVGMKSVELEILSAPFVYCEPIPLRFAIGTWPMIKLKLFEALEH